MKGAENKRVFSAALVQMLGSQRFQEHFFVANACFDGGDQLAESAGESVVCFQLNFPDPPTKGPVHLAQGRAVGTPGGFARRQGHDALMVTEAAAQCQRRIHPNV